MFETAEIGNKTEKSAFKRELPKVREALLEAQRMLAASKSSAVVLMHGVEGAGKTETVNQLLEWLDARGIQVHALSEPSDEERERPPFWRFWRNLPPKGRMGFFVGSWYTRPIVDRTFGRIGEGKFNLALDRINLFEEMLAREGVLLLKFWLHLGQRDQRRRLKAIESDPATSWRVSKLDWKYARRYDDFRAVSESALRRTDSGEAPWHIVESADWRYRSLTVSRLAVTAIGERIAAEKSAPPRPAVKPPPLKPKKPNIISRLDLKQHLDKEPYDKRVARLQAQLYLLYRKLKESERSLILVFEGPDAAGKGGTIRRVTQALDARNYQVMSVAAPTDEERAHPYLWRFWRHLPRLGRATIYDRSWYGRVLVERVEGFATPQEWQRAYSEINEFEAQLTEFGTVVIKFWLAIGADEQLRRFKDREVTPYKQYKITEEDWRNRGKWGAYEAAACDMIERTNTSAAPWVLVEANDKNFARVKVLTTLCERLKKAGK
jgi:polyphosphate:AMP phosphotransferase